MGAGTSVVKKKHEGNPVTQEQKKKTRKHQDIEKEKKALDTNRE